MGLLVQRYRPWISNTIDSTVRDFNIGTDSFENSAYSQAIRALKQALAYEPERAITQAPLAKALKRQQAQATRIMPQKPTWTILLIDAHRMSRNTLKSQFEYYQYIVLPAVDAQSAVQTFQQNQRTVDLVVLDLELEDAPGTKVLEILRKLSPELKIIAITDHSVTEDQPAFEGIADLLRNTHPHRQTIGVGGQGFGPYITKGTSRSSSPTN